MFDRSDVSWLVGDWGKAALAGALGGVVRWLTLRESWREGAVSLVVGGICAVYLGPIIEPLLEPSIGVIAPDGDADGFSSFIVGLAGISLAGLLIDIVRGRRRQEGRKDGK